MKEKIKPIDLLDKIGIDPYTDIVLDIISV
jgi:hypothetical protein